MGLHSQRGWGKMFKYKNEAHLSGQMTSYMRKHGWFVQRIETGSIGRGVPDVYAVNPQGVAVWIELKRVHQSVGKRDRVKIPWRPGQQAWLRECTAYKQQCYTLAAFDDCFLLIRHQRIWSDDTVLVSCCDICTHFNELF